MDAAAIGEALERIAGEIGLVGDGSQVILAGIQQGGVVLAQRLGVLLEKQWKRKVPIGQLDVAMHRDDLDRRAAPPVHPTQIPGDITGKTVILVDDVLFRGRTTRAALDALIDLGRPKRIQLAVLVDRGHRELPIHADFIGKTITTEYSDIVDVCFHEDGKEDAVFLKRE